MGKKDQRNTNFWITSFTNFFLLFKSKNLFDLKSICRTYCHKNLYFFLYFYPLMLLFYRVYIIVYMHIF